MRSRYLIATCLLITFLISCAPQTPQPSLQTTLMIYRFDPPAFIELSTDFQVLREIPFGVPPNCALFDVFPAPLGSFLAIELSCPNGQTVLFLDTDTTAVTQPVTASDSHYLAWAVDGEAAYLKVDSLGNTQILRVSPTGMQELITIPAFTYDLASSEEGFTFTVSGGLGQGSELYLAERDGRRSRVLYEDPYHYISFARFSPDGRQIAFLKIPDTQTPFTIGELWIMDRNGSNARKLVEADAGHGYAANWSPDGERIAFVVRENPEEERADHSSAALVSNLYLVDMKTGEVTRVTHLQDGRVETPHWSPEGNTLAFNLVINDRMQVQVADLATGAIRPLTTEPTCCPAWIRK
jgi:dipeptidyl aminopeptidase/acylaminoacyl peptidase